MQAITTKFLGPTNSRGTRIKASCHAGSLTVSYDYAIDDNHRAAALALVKKLGWTDSGYGTLISGTDKDGNGCHVFNRPGHRDTYKTSELAKVAGSEIIGVKFFGDVKESRQINVTPEEFEKIRAILGAY